MRSTSRITIASVLLLLAVCGLAGAVINTEGNLGVVRTLSARPLKNVKMNIQLGVNYAGQKDYVQPPASYSTKTVDDVMLNGTDTVHLWDPNHQISANFSVGLGVAPFWDLAVSLPLYYDMTSFGKSGGGLGDLAASTKLCIPPAGKVWFNAFSFAATFPTGSHDGWFPRNAAYDDNSDSSPVSPYRAYTSDKVVLRPMWLMTLDLADRSNVPFAMHLNAGANLTLGGVNRHTIIGAFAMEYTPVSYITLFAEAWAEQRISTMQNGQWFRDAVYVTPGIKFTTPGGIAMKLAADFCVSSKDPEDRTNWTRDRYNYSTTAAPTWGVQFSFGWCGFLNVQDKDRDGIKDDDDKCPKAPEDVDGFEDSDGCPDLDNDNDGILDSLDKCPNQPEEKDGFQDEDGCPDLDNDKDGIADSLDKCPNQREDFDGFEDKDGCPDFDNDKDGIADSLDKCPTDPEDMDGFEDKDGCPDLDNDQDGIPDVKDKCPGLAETYNGYQDEDGCPDTLKKPSTMPKSQILRGVQFQGATAAVLPQSFSALDGIANEMKEYPDIQIEIRGHTDAAGKQTVNMLLSQQRADAVMSYMISKGIEAGRMRAIGYGSSSPIADNRSAAGRTQNRRIEVVRLR
jgi:outer membrane protein OmpA-like peptidoglycan-associated protein